MLRPSDFAPNGVIFYDILGLTLRQNFTIERLVLEQNHMNVTFFVSWYNDVQRKGFKVILPKSIVVKIDANAIWLHERTREHRGQDGPVFIALRSPYNAVDFSTVTRILVEAIVLAGLSTNEFSVKSFRTTVAMTAIVQTWIPRLSKKWADGKKQEVFYVHVHSKRPLEYIESLLCAKYILLCTFSISVVTQL